MIARLLPNGNGLLTSFILGFHLILYTARNRRDRGRSDKQSLYPILVTASHSHPCFTLCVSRKKRSRDDSDVDEESRLVDGDTYVMSLFVSSTFILIPINCSMYKGSVATRIVTGYLRDNKAITPPLKTRSAYVCIRLQIFSI